MQQEKQKLEADANRVRRKQAGDKNDATTKMKGKNRPSKRHRKKQTNVIDEKKPEVLKRLREEVRHMPLPIPCRCWAPCMMCCSERAAFTVLTGEAETNQGAARQAGAARAGGGAGSEGPEPLLQMMKSLHLASMQR